MKLLASPRSIDEAAIVLCAGVDILDVKNPDEGSLGAARAPIVAEMRALAEHHNRPLSVALGDLSHQPGTASLAAAGAAHLRADFIKAGLFGSRTVNEAADMLAAICHGAEAARTQDRDRPTIVASGYADAARFDGLSPMDLVRAASTAQVDCVMLDTYFKDGQSLFNALTESQLRDFISEARKNALQVALAGSLRLSDLPILKKLQPDVIGVRGALCRKSDRQAAICADQTSLFINALRTPSPADAKESA